MDQVLCFVQEYESFISPGIALLGVIIMVVIFKLTVNEMKSSQKEQFNKMDELQINELNEREKEREIRGKEKKLHAVVCMLIEFDMHRAHSRSFEAYMHNENAIWNVLNSIYMDEKPQLPEGLIKFVNNRLTNNGGNPLGYCGIRDVHELYDLDCSVREYYKILPLPEPPTAQQ